MPNWCNNKVTISGEEADIQKFVDLVEEDFNFNKIIPLPKELEGTRCPMKYVSQEQYEKELEKYKNCTGENDSFHSSFCVTEKISKEYKEKFGVDNWYDWCCASWGTKWPASEVEVMKQSELVEYSFMTAWSPPENIYYKLRELFPDLDIVWFFDEPGEMLAGYLGR